MLKWMGADMQKGTGPSSKFISPLHKCTLSIDTQNLNCSIITLPRETQFVHSCFQFYMLRDLSMGVWVQSELSFTPSIITS